MARYSPKHKSETRERILEAADRVIKDRGIERASVDAVMRGADLTVGGFYAHFGSKEELAREAMLFGLERSMERLLTSLDSIADDRLWLKTLIHDYLHQVDRGSLAAACPLTVMLPEVARGGPDFQRAFGERTGALLDRVAARFPDVAGRSRREVASFVFASCAGAISLARAIEAPRARERLIAATEAMLTHALGLDGVAA
jgi:TetR/AcrR family transcriptional regulator, transcriptional repressor for nem operon